MQQVKHIPGRGRVYIPASYFWGRTSEKTPSRNCLIIPERPHCGLPREVRTEPEVSFRRLWWRQSQAFTGPLTIHQTVSRRGILRSSASEPPTIALFIGGSAILIIDTAGLLSQLRG